MYIFLYNARNTLVLNVENTRVSIKKERFSIKNNIFYEYKKWWITNLNRVAYKPRVKIKRSYLFTFYLKK